jgi:hypothetical protein
VEIDRQVTAFSDAFNNPKAQIKMTGPVARRMARQAVAADNARRNTCPQVELHVKAHGGRCACGWSA